MRALYVHIPFCKQKCFYCDFNSYSGKDHLVEEYIKALKKELSIELIKCNDKSCFKTIYFGGGTPSAIPSKYIKEIMQDTKCEGEVTLELNPGTITRKKLEDYKEAGINRLSIGLQTTNDELLKKIGRIHSLKDFEETFKMAREVGFNNISVDLMFGLPSQTIEDVSKDLDYLITLNPDHISCYSLIVHDELARKNPNAFNNLPSDEQEREMYYLICDELKKNGYIQYEISNFAKPGYESKHNLCYWNQDEYYGIGAGASSYINNVRYKNIDSIEEYIEHLSNNQDGFKVVEEVQNEESKIKEYMILKLRLIEGVSEYSFKSIFNKDIFIYFKNELEKLNNLKLIEITGTDDKYIKLTKKGLDLANIVWEEFI